MYNTNLTCGGLHNYKMTEFRTYENIGYNASMICLTLNGLMFLNQLTSFYYCSNTILVWGYIHVAHSKRCTTPLALSFLSFYHALSPSLPPPPPPPPPLIESHSVVSLIPSLQALTSNPRLIPDEYDIFGSALGQRHRPPNVARPLPREVWGEP